MHPISSIASSGIHAALLGMAAAAHNIADAQTPGFRRQLLFSQEHSGGGVTATIELSTHMQDAAVALADDVVQQLVSGYLFKANVLTLRTEQKMLGSLLDLQA